MSVCECGRSSTSEAKFCQDCGRSLGPTTDGVDLLNAGPTGPTQDAVVHLQRSRRSWLLFAGVLLGAIAVWSVQSANRSSPPEAATQPDGAVTPTTTPQPESATLPAIAGSDQQAASDQPTEPVPPTPSALNVQDGPILGDEVGYSLFVNTTRRPAVLDLDSGIVAYHEGIPVDPIAISGSWVVISRSTGSRVAKLPLSSLSGRPSPVFEEPNIVFVGAVPELGRTEPGHFWTVVYRENGSQSVSAPTLELVDLTSGSILPHPLAHGASEGASGGTRIADGPGGLLTGPAGGVYIAENDRYELATEGRLITADEERVLVETCDSAMTCSRSWLDRTNWQPLDLRLPDPSANFTALMPETDWVLTSRLPDRSQATLLNVLSGRTVDVAMPENRYAFNLPAISPDGRWLAEPHPDLQSVLFTDLFTGDRRRFVFREPIRSPLFFVSD